MISFSLQIAPSKFRFLPWTGSLLVHAIFPLLDILIGEDTSNPPDAVMKALEETPLLSSHCEGVYSASIRV